MNHRFLLKMAVCAACLLVVSCYKEDTSELMVYIKASDLTVEEFEKYQADLDAAEALVKANEATVEAYLHNSSNPDCIYGEFRPDYFVATKSGVVGVIDLGLTHKWACVNVGGEMLPDEAVTLPRTFKDYLGVETKPEKANVRTESAIPYSAYFLSGMYAGTECVTKKMIEDYISGSKKYAEEYTRYASSYYQVANNRYSFMAGHYDAYVVFGYPELWSKNRQSTATDKLKANEDAATVLWGDSWKTPSKSDLEELVNRCTWKGALLINGQYGAVVTGPNGKSLWLPLVGAKDTDGTILKENNGYYMSDSKDYQNTLYHVWTLSCGKSGGIVRTQAGELGYSLRPVLK